MVHRSFLPLPAITLLLFGGLLASACVGSRSSAGAGETFEANGDNVVSRGEGSLAALSEEEVATYKADMAYVHSLMPAGVTATLNHADDRQHRFVLARVKMAGKTPKNAPELFKGIEDLRAAHIAQGLRAKQGVAEIHLATAAATQSIQDLHFLDALDIVNQNTQLKVGVLGSLHTTTTHAYVDVAAWDIANNQIGPYTFVELFDSQMVFASPSTLGNLSQTTLPTVFGDSLLVEDSVANGHQELYTFTIRARTNPLSPPLLSAPADVSKDGCINFCLFIQNSDCDYQALLQGIFPFPLAFPLQGSVAISPSFAAMGYTFDTNKIAQYAAGTAVDSSGAPDPGGSITAVLTNQGGGCPLQDPSNTHTFAEQLFWKTVTIAASGNTQTLTWNMSGTNLANFGTACAVVQDHVELDVNVEVPLVDAQGNRSIVPLYISNGLNSQPSIPPLSQCFHVINS
jgi:hypothetical protein